MQLSNYVQFQSGICIFRGLDEAHYKILFQMVKLILLLEETVFSESYLILKQSSIRYQGTVHLTKVFSVQVQQTQAPLPECCQPAQSPPAFLSLRHPSQLGFAFPLKCCYQFAHSLQLFLSQLSLSLYLLLGLATQKLSAQR